MRQTKTGQDKTNQASQETIRRDQMRWNKNRQDATNKRRPKRNRTKWDTTRSGEMGQNKTRKDKTKWDKAHPATVKKKKMFFTITYVKYIGEVFNVYIHAESLFLFTARVSGIKADGLKRTRWSIREAAPVTWSQ